MPKIVSRNVISQSKEELIETDPSKILTIQYCLCGEFLLVMPGPLESLAIRPIDGALVLRNKSKKVLLREDSGERKVNDIDNDKDKEEEIKVYKLNAVGGIGVEALGVLIKRGNNFEYQRRLHCPRCRLVIGYETTPGENRKGDATFLLPGSMTDTQNKIPSNAFGEIPNTSIEEEEVELREEMVVT